MPEETAIDVSNSQMKFDLLLENPLAHIAILTDSLYFHGYCIKNHTNLFINFVYLKWRWNCSPYYWSNFLLDSKVTEQDENLLLICTFVQQENKSVNIQFAAVVISENHNNTSAEMTNCTAYWLSSVRWKQKKKLLLGVMWYGET